MGVLWDTQEVSGLLGEILGGTWRSSGEPWEVLWVPWEVPWSPLGLGGSFPLCTVKDRRSIEQKPGYKTRAQGQWHCELQKCCRDVAGCVAEVHCRVLQGRIAGHCRLRGRHCRVVLQGIARWYCRVLQGGIAGCCRVVLRGIAGHCRVVLQGVAGWYCRVLQGLHLPCNGVQYPAISPCNTLQ